MNKTRAVLLSLIAVLSMIMLFLALIVTHVICIFHEWIPASYVQAQMCKFCGTTVGAPLGHDWIEADCKSPKTCLNCEKTYGNAAEHSWMEATCETPKTCANCNATEGLPLSHDWDAATCLQPETCKICGLTQGATTNHTPGQKAVSEYIVNGYYIEKQACIYCGTQLESKKAYYSSFVENGKLICTPHDLMERVDVALSSISGCTLTAGTKYSDGSLYGVVWNSNGKAILAISFLGVGTDNILTSAYSNELRGCMAYIYDGDSLSYVLLAFVQAIDPSLSFEEGKELASDILSATKVGQEYEMNGIRYVLTKYNGSWVFGFTVIT